MSPHGNGWVGSGQKAAKCQYKEYEKLPMEHFINGLNVAWMVDEIFKDVATLEDIEDATSESVLLWLHRLGAQRVQISVLNEIKEVQD